MARFVSIMAMAHAPGVTGWIESTPAHEREAIEAGYDELGRIMDRAKPDVLIGVANDHMLNLPLKNPPHWCVGTAPAWDGPAEFFKAWLKQPGYHVEGHSEVAAVIHREAKADGVDIDARDDLLFDDNWSVPLWYLGYDFPLVPIHMNCINPPVPTPEACVHFGKVLRRIVHEVLPADLRVGLIATGGLSHEPGGPRYFTLDPAFDRWFLDLMEESDETRVVREATVERMNAAGGGGTTELLAWMVAMAAAGGTRGRATFYVGSKEMRCGIGAAVWERFA
jgi:aromatic ring-opening dioxygenase catalytic subunit (LigB family)